MNNSFLSHADAAFRNRNTIVHYIKKHGPVSRTDIWENIDMSRAAVTKIVRNLQESDILTETVHGESTGGRKPLFLVFNGKKNLFFAFDWSIHRLYLMDLNGYVYFETTLSFQEQLHPTSFAEVLNSAINNVLKSREIPEDNLSGLILAMPGIIDPKNCTILSSVELGWQNIDMRSLFAEKFGKKVYVERTGNILVLSAGTHLKKSYAHIQLFTLGTDGIGVSSLIHGSCQHGEWCMHGELGHIKLVSDVQCRCGQTGCLEAIVKQLFEKNNGKLTEEILDYLAIGISASVNICDSHIVLIGSYVDLMDDTQKEYLINSIQNKVTSSKLRQFDIHFANNKKQLMLKGLCDYMFEQLFPLE